ncbi:hypothetical protein [Fodinibius halophilus]|nr:hypothetical protein [Fodinibius halophilus]
MKRRTFNFGAFSRNAEIIRVISIEHEADNNGINLSDHLPTIRYQRIG